MCQFCTNTLKDLLCNHLLGFDSIISMRETCPGQPASWGKGVNMWSRPLPPAKLLQPKPAYIYKQMLISACCWDFCSSEMSHFIFSNIPGFKVYFVWFECQSPSTLLWCCGYDIAFLCFYFHCIYIIESKVYFLEIPFFIHSDNLCF